MVEENLVNKTPLWSVLNNWACRIINKEMTFDDVPEQSVDSEVLAQVNDEIEQSAVAEFLMWLKDRKADVQANFVATLWYGISQRHGNDMAKGVSELAVADCCCAGHEEDILRERIEMLETGGSHLVSCVNERALLLVWIKLADAYMELSNIIRARGKDEVDKAISYYERAFCLLRQEPDNEFYVNLLKNLGMCHVIAGRRCESAIESRRHFQSAIPFLNEASKFFGKETSPESYVFVEASLGEAHMNSCHVSERSALELAAKHFENALSIHSRLNLPVQRVDTLIRLGCAYLTLTEGRFVDRLEQAHGIFEQAKALYERLVPSQKDVHAELRAEIFHGLGRVYFNKHEGDRLYNLKLSEQYFEESASISLKENSDLGHAQALYYLGRVSAEKALLFDNNKEYLRSCINYLERSLKVMTADLYLSPYCYTKLLLGEAYGKLYEPSWAQNLNTAIGHLTDVFERTADGNPPKLHAAAAYELGVCYRNMPLGDRTENLALAIDYFQQSLDAINVQKEVSLYGAVKAALSHAYRMLFDHSTALLCCDDALRLIERQRDLTTYAALQEARGLALRDHAVAAETREEFVKYLLSAIDSFNEVLSARDRSREPWKWGNACNNLGNTFLRLAKYVDSEANTERAITFYRDALAVLTEKEYPLDFVKIQGNMLQGLIEAARQRKVEDISDIHETVESAIAVCRRLQAIDHELILSKRVADLLYERGSYWDALQYYEKAISLLEDILLASTLWKSKEYWLGLFRGTYRCAITCCVRLGHYERAIELVESSKSRYLEHLLVQSDSLAADSFPESLAWYKTIVPQIRQLEIQLQMIENQDLGIGQLLSPVKELKQLNHAVRAKLADKFPDLARSVKPLTYGEIANLVPHDEAAIVLFSLAENSTIAFVVHAHGAVDSRTPFNKNMKPESSCNDVIEVTGFGTRQLQSLLFGESTQSRNEGLVAKYYEYRRTRSEAMRKAWMDVLEHILQQLYEAILSPLQRRLDDLKVRELIFVPDLYLHLLPLHAAFSEENGQKHYMMDKYQISYSPSCSTLYRTMRRNSPKSKRNFLGMVGADDLEFADFEMAVAASFFRYPKLIPYTEVTSEGFISKANKFRIIHAISHGSFDPDNPLESGIKLRDEKLKLSTIISSADLMLAELVVLSACETSMLDFQDCAYEYLGLPTGFLAAGARTLIASMWEVNDLATALVMWKFYENWCNCGMGKAAALNNAQLWLRGLTIGELVQRLREAEKLTKGEIIVDHWITECQTLPSTTKPFSEELYYWAAFQMIGSH